MRVLHRRQPRLGGRGLSVAEAADPGARLEVELSLVLPEAAQRDECIQRLRDRLAALRGVGDVHIHDRDGVAVLCTHYDPSVQTLQALDLAVRHAGATLTDRYRHVSLRVSDMDCGDCAASLEHVLARLDGVLSVSANYAAERLRVEFDQDRLTLSQLIGRVRAMGYDVERPPPEGWLRTHRELVFALAAGALLAAGLAGQLLGLPAPAVSGIYATAYVAGGYDAARHGVAAALHLRLQIDALMVLAAIGAAVVGDWAEGALLLFLFSLGHALEHQAMGRARRAVEALGQLTPRTARVRRGGEEGDVPVEQVVRDDVVIVRPGERVPVDGTVIAGHSLVDQSPVTGESAPVVKTVGSEVYAGSVNHDAALDVAATKLANESTLARVATMVEQAQTQKSPTQRLTERFTRIFVPSVMLLALVVIVLPPLLGWLTWQAAFLRGMTLLVAASPCALAIGTPATVLSGIAQAAREGVLIKGGAALENLGRVRAMAFDKTGTLTVGHPVVTDVQPAAGVERATLLGTAAAVESHSTHPLADAVAAASTGLEPVEAGQISTVPGEGMSAVLDGKLVRVGRPSFVLAPPPGSTPMWEAVNALEREGKTVIAVSADGLVLGLLAAADQPRDNAAATIGHLRRLGVTDLVMLTGDNGEVASRVSTVLGLTDWRAALLPAGKVQAVADLTGRYENVAMVGDGINDAPALARSTVGIAMGAAGTDIALETADVALMADDLGKLPVAIALARRSRRIILQNLALALGVIAILVPAAVIGAAGIGVAVAIHEGSTLVVVANALRLLSLRTPAGGGVLKAQGPSMSRRPMCSRRPPPTEAGDARPSYRVSLQDSAIRDPD